MTLTIKNIKRVGSDTLESVTVEDGLIVSVDDDAPEGARIVDCAGRCLAPGIMDWGVKIGEPGERHRESMRSAALAYTLGSRRHSARYSSRLMSSC